MRLQLIAAVALLASVAHAQHRAASQVDVYSDDRITVISPAARAQVEAADGLTVRGGYAVDIVSGATRALSADLVSSATRFEERRHQADIGLDSTLKQGWQLGFNLVVSTEPDYQTWSLGVTLSMELLDRMATLTVAYHSSVESVGLASGEVLRDHLISHKLDLSWTHILGRTTTLSVLFTGMASLCGDVLGCQSSPYRFVAVLPEDTTSLAGGVAVRERHPARRLRGALGMKLSQVVARGVALHVGYRAYLDSWAVHGHTVNAVVAAALAGDRLLLRGHGRFVWQSAADFYDAHYRVADPERVPTHRTGDQELSGMIGGQVGLTVEWSFLSVGPLLRLALSAYAAHLWYHYPDFPARPDRRAWLGGGGVRAEF